MRTPSSIVLATAWVLVAALPTVSQTIPPEQWKRFSSPVAGFSVLLPGDPQESTSEPSFSPFYVEGMKFYAAHVGLDAGSFSAVVRVYSQPIDQPDVVASNFDRFQSFAAKGAHAKVVSQKESTIQGLPSRRVSLVFGINGTYYTMSQMFVIKGNRLFQLIAMDGAAPLTAEDVDRFFNSFNVTGEAKDWKRSRSDPNQVVEKSEPEPAQVTTGVTAFTCPIYPQAAKEARVGGGVQMQVTTDGKKITDLKVTGIPVLAQAAEENLRTWKFADDAPKNFTVWYWYVLEGEYEPDPVYKCRAKLQLPNKVEVSTSW
jgi:hypothetical protein